MKSDKGGLTADDFAIIIAILVVITDCVKVWALMKAKEDGK